MNTASNESRCASFTTGASIGALCDGASRMPQAHHLLPLLQAASRGELALAAIHKTDDAFPTRSAERWTRAAVVLIGDDPWPRGEALGPDGWACAKRLRCWRL